MDRRVKERLIGASILVAIIVLIVPELLSGPKPAAPPASRLSAAAAAADSHRVIEASLSEPLAGASPPGAVADPSVAVSPALAPASVLPATTPAAPPSSPPSTALTRASAPAPVETSSAPPISASRAAWAVQLGSFASRDNAENLQRQLKMQGFSVHILAGGSGPAARYRVRVGPLADRESADRIAAKLKALGHVSSMVPPAPVE